MLEPRNLLNSVASDVSTHAGQDKPWTDNLDAALKQVILGDDPNQLLHGMDQTDLQPLGKL